jgi:Mg2+ and Co2+ transporter CorA
MEKETETENKKEKEIDLLDDNLLKLRFTDYLYSSNLIDDYQYEICRTIEKSNSTRKEFKSTMSYNLITTVGGKSNDQIIDIFHSNRRWLKIERVLKSKTKLIENTICSIRSTGTILEEIGEERFIDIVMELSDVLERLEVMLYGSKYEVKIKQLNRKVREYGLRKISNKLRITTDTVTYILSGGKNFKYYNLEKLLRFFKIG